MTTTPDRFRRWSLRNQLLLLALGATTLAWAVGGVVAVRASQDVATRMRDERLVQLSGTVLAFVRHELAEQALAERIGAEDPHYADRRAGLDLRYLYQVLWRGQVVMHSPDASPERPLAGTLQAGFADRQVDGRALRTYVTEADGQGLQVQVAERQDATDAAVPLPGWPTLVLMLLSLATVGGLAAALVMKALRPLTAAERLLRRRAPHELHPLPLAGLPDELRPLMHALNEHMARTAERLSRERGFTALAAHELRTPLAALRMRVQVAQRAAGDAANPAPFDALLTSVDRCDHLIDQLLTLARVELGNGAAPSPLDLRRLCDQVSEDLHADPRWRDADIAVTGPATTVNGWDFALEVMVRNLVANALAHGARRSAVSVSVCEQDDGVALRVEDSGPGIAAGDRARVFDRFVRLEGAQRVPGVGLGLSIVRAVADAHGASVELMDSALGGLCVRVQFPAAAAPAGNPAPAP